MHPQLTSMMALERTAELMRSAEQARLERGERIPRSKRARRNFSLRALAGLHLWRAPSRRPQARHA
jgi:hypothetical protein